jgi:hypothetical protein
MASSQGVVSIGGGLSTKSLPRDVGITDSKEGGVIHSGPPPPGWLLPINVTSIPVPDNPPMDQEIWQVVAKLPNGCAAGATWMKAEHLKDWLCGIKREEVEASVERAGDR